MMTPLRISRRTIDALVKVIIGDRVDVNGSIASYRSVAKLQESFAEDLSSAVPATLQRESRSKDTAVWLRSLNGTNDPRRVIEAAVRPADYEGSEYLIEDAVAYLNPFLAHDASKMIATFLVESYLAQCDRGLLSGPSPPHNVEKASGGAA